MNLETIVAIVTAAVVGFAWMFYLRRIDFFHVESWKNLIGVFLLGGIVSFIPLGLHRLIPAFFQEHFDPSNFYEVFGYQIIRVALVEEVVKVLPLIGLMLAFPRLREEPSNFMVYGSIGALGFASVENVEYAMYYGNELLLTRSAISTFTHIGCTGVLSYGIWYLAMRRRDISGVATFMLCFVGALSCHALFNAMRVFEISPEEGYLRLLDDIPTLVLVEVWAVMMNNAINLSPHFKNNLALDRAVLFRVMGILMLVGMCFLAIPYFQIEYGFLLWVYQSIWFIVLLFIISMRLTRLVLIKDFTRPIIPRLPFHYARYGSLPMTKPHFTINGLPFNEAPYTNRISEEVMIRPLTRRSTQIGSRATVKLTDKHYIGHQAIVYACDFIEADDPMSSNEYYYLMPKLFGKMKVDNSPIMALLAWDEPIENEAMEEVKPRFLGWVLWEGTERKPWLKLFLEYLR